MDNKTIFIKTKKGMDEMQGRTTHLPGDIKRALLMVDGDSTFAEISKRAAPSLRSSLPDLFQELVKGGFIQDKDQSRSKNDNIPKMSIPVKIATPQKNQAAGRDGELDFRSGFAGSSQSPAAESAKARMLREEAEQNIQLEIEAARYAQLEAEQARKASEAAAAAQSRVGQEARARQDSAEMARQQAQRQKEEQEALQIRIKLDAARERAEAAARLRTEPAAPTAIDADAARIREEAERIVRLERETRAREAREREELAHRAREEAERIVRLEREAREREELARKAREEAERIVRLEREAREREELARRAREEAERLIRLEREARQLEEQELKAAKVREEVQRLLRQEQQQREAKPPEPAAPASAEGSEGWGLFSFDTFQVDEPLYTSESHIDRKTEQKQAPPAQQARPAAATPAAKSGSFAFDEFKIEEPPLPVEKSRAGLSGAAQNTARPAPADKRQPAPGKQPARQPVTAGPSQEQIQRAKQEQERKAAEAQAAKKTAEDQARVWAQAEQRALEAARAEASQAGKQLSMADAPSARPAPAARVRRKQFSFGKLAGLVFKLGLLALVLIIGALFIIPYVVSTREYLPKAEQLLSTKLHQPVHIGSLSGRILPTPRLEAGEIYIGNAKQLEAKTAQINFSFTGLFTDVKPVNSIEFQDIKVRGAWLADASGWLQNMANEARYPVSRMLISKGTLDADAFQLTDIEGELDFDPNGKFTQASLRASGGKYDLGINAAADSKLNVALTVRNNALPLFPNWTFDVLTAKGQLTNGELSIGNFDGQIFGGAVEGNADITWRSGWAAQGTLNAKRITMQKLSKLLDGSVDGAARFRMASADLGKLDDSATLDGSFNSSDGTISGLEIADTARKLSRENMPGGRTHYDTLAGSFSFGNGIYHFKQARITASALTAVANFDADTAKQQLSGKINVNLSVSGRTAAPVELKLGGAIDSPTLVYAP